MSIFTEIIKELKFNTRYRKTLMPEQKKLDSKAPKEGDIAPDFTIYDIGGKDSITLSEFRGKKPVALVFGSYT